MAKVRLCRTGNQHSTGELGRRLQRAGLQEIRLDLLDTLDDVIDRLQEACNTRCIVAAGPQNSNPAVVPVLEQALEAGAAFVDMDADLARSDAGADLVTRRGEQVIVSAHGDYISADHARAVADRLNGIPAGAGKLALAVEDTAQAAELADITLEHPTQIKIATGEPGRITRLLPRAFGSAWTYVADDEASITASGQLTMEEAVRCRIDRGDELGTMALVGGCGVHDSPGVETYNRLFVQRDLPWRYIALVAAEPTVFEVAKKLGITRLSVTTPLKFAAAKMCDRLDGWAKKTVAVNSLRWDENHGWTGRNTDAEALAALCHDFAIDTQSRCLIIGSGATATGAAAVLRDIGCPLYVATRHPDALTDKPGFGDATALAPTHIPDTPWDLIINCSPVGNDGASLPVPPPVIAAAKGVIDLVLPGKNGPSPLVRCAHAAGVPTEDGLRFWRLQGAMQMSWFLDAPVTDNDLEPATKTGISGGTRLEGKPLLVPEQIALVGMRGSGKSTLGKHLAESLGWEFLDSDAEVEQRLQCSIAELFARGDEALFRAAEAAVIAEALKRNRLVLATGGGCVQDETTRYLLAEAFTVWLDAPVLTLLRRCENGDRPPLTHLDMEDEMRFLLPRRAPLYRQCARLMVSTETYAPQEALDVVQHAWRLFYRHHLR